MFSVGVLSLVGVDDGEDDVLIAAVTAIPPAAMRMDPSEVVSLILADLRVGWAASVLLSWIMMSRRVNSSGEGWGVWWGEAFLVREGVAVDGDVEVLLVVSRWRSWQAMMVRRISVATVGKEVKGWQGCVSISW